jgi:SAM-dependent methyltransferase
LDFEKIFKSLEQDVGLIIPELNDMWLNYLYNHKERYQDLLSQIQDLDPKNKILEVGSFPGHFTVILKKLGYEIQGVDIKPERAEKLWEKYNLLIHNVNIETDSIPIPTNTFDLILFTEVIEHLRLNPLSVLQELHRMLKPNGLLLLTTPNITPSMRLKFFWKEQDYLDDPIEQFKKLKWLGHMGHVRLYSYKELKNILDFVGLQTISLSYSGKKPSLNIKRTILFSLLNIVGIRYSKDKFRPYVFIKSRKK